MNNEKTLEVVFARDKYGQFRIEGGGEWEEFDPSSESPSEHLLRWSQHLREWEELEGEW
jgi:hypothetical protein